MANELPIQGLPKTGAVQPGGTTNAKSASSDGGVAFRALLDDLEAKARDLQAQSKALEKPEDLAGAVQGAKASLDDALSIRDRLLEAFREARMQETAPPEPKRKI
ncbi:MAG: flagellar hook-basal body complex protein FliE [Planctomycetes bacterium]|jgi:flagellar hook-basal body complex protein FliE|nr:flagellar hook-basal body complex protein FliE [Planctomycetota bacterium]